ncbi:MAG: hypothetical protein AAGA48_17395 [Myxococcota bacterium]
MRTWIFSSALVGLSGCWNLPEDDAGDRAFVMWSTNALLGRGPVSPQELTALISLEHQHGREALLDTLMQQPEFVDHWDDLLMHQLRVSTEDASNAKERCYTEAYVPQNYDWALTNHLRTANWDERFCVSNESASDDLTLDAGGRTAGKLAEEHAGRTLVSRPRDDGRRATTSASKGRRECFEFTMKDVLRASLRTDRMDALLRARLAPLAAFEGAVDARRTVFDSYFNRHQDCLECHTTTYSTTNPVPRNGNWDRYVPAVDYIDLEFSAFRSLNDDGTMHDGSIGGNQMQQRFRDLFNRIQANANESGHKPWGMDETCVGDGLLEHPRPRQNGTPTAFAGWGEHTGTQVRILDFLDEFDDGLRDLVDGSPITTTRSSYETLADGEPNLASCDVCHQATGVDGMLNGYPVPLDLETLTASMSAQRLRLTITAGSAAGQMPLFLLNDETLDEVVGYLIHQQTDPVPVYTDPVVGMAHLTALTFVEDVAKHLSGQALTLEHGFPRNADQALVLKELSEGLVENDWSLRYVIKQIALSEFVNRNAPEDSPHDPYVLPMVLDPWHDTPAHADEDPLTGVARNGQGELIHRWPVPTLIRKRNAALGWSQPTHFNDIELQTDLGAYVSHFAPGFTRFGMASALAWETNHTVGGAYQCRSPYGGGDDVIDALTDATHGLTLRQALQALKFRMIGVEWLWADREAGLAGLESNQISEIWNVELSAPAHEHREVVRDYCAVLLASPQFVLSGLPVDQTGLPYTDPDIPCLDAECSSMSWCEHYRRDAVDLGYGSWSCVTAPVGESG